MKVTNVELEPLRGPDMLLMMEKRIRGRISRTSNRSSWATNPFMSEAYDETKAMKNNLS